MTSYIIQESINVMLRAVCSELFPPVEEIREICRGYTDNMSDRAAIDTQAVDLDKKLSIQNNDSAFFSRDLCKAIDNAGKMSFKDCRATIGSESETYLAQLPQYSQLVSDAIDKYRAGHPLQGTVKATLRWMLFHRPGRRVPFPLMTESVVEFWAMSLQGVKHAMTEVSVCIPPVNNVLSRSSTSLL
jgi:hypothetical protein